MHAMDIVVADYFGRCLLAVLKTHYGTEFNWMDETDVTGMPESQHQKDYKER